MTRTLLVALALLGLSVPAQAARFDLERWLDEPDVKLVAVEVYSDYCEPCKAAAPRWEALRKRYKADGLKLVVINVDDYDSDRQCKTLPWRPDLLICSPEAGETLGVCERGRCSVPQAFLWSWQGNMLVSGQSHVVEVERAIRDYLDDHPRVQLAATNEAGKPDRALKRQVAAALGRSGKLTVVADAEMKKRLAEVVKDSHRPSARDDQRCQVGAEVSANSLLAIERFTGGALSLTLSDAATGCQRAAASVTVDARGLEKAVDRAVYELMAQLKQREIQMPRSRTAPPARKSGRDGLKVRKVGEGGDAWEPPEAAVLTVAFASDPPGARVTLNGAPLCEATPCKREVPAGSHQVAMTKAQYTPRVRKVRFEAGQNVSWNLQPNFGALTVQSEPPGVTVTVDGEVVGKTPIQRVALSEGAHTVAIGDACYQPQTRELTLPRGESHTLDVVLEPRPAGLKVSAVDAQGDIVLGDVYVDGQRLGLTGKALKVGLCAQSVEVRHGTLGTWSAALSLREKETTQVIAQLGPDEAPPYDGPITTGFVHVKRGAFLMGSPGSESGRSDDEGPARLVTVSRPFELQSHEVTLGEWRALMGTSPGKLAPCGDNCPVVGVNWWDALAYANALSRREGLAECYELTGCWGKPGDGAYGCFGVNVKAPSGQPTNCQGYRLPTEAEWEYAARAGTTGPRHGELSEVAWYGGNSWLKRHPVGTKTANAWGLYDMLGNAWEWTWDRKDDYTPGSAVDPTGPESGAKRVFRGCGWEWLGKSACRSAYRSGFIPVFRNLSIGFRPARTLTRP